MTLTAFSIIDCAEVKGSNPCCTMVDDLRADSIAIVRPYAAMRDQELLQYP